MVKDSIKRSAKNLFIPLCFSLTGLALASCEANSPTPQQSSAILISESVNPDTVTEIVKIFEDLDICLAGVRDNGTRGVDSSLLSAGGFIKSLRDDTGNNSPIG